MLLTESVHKASRRQNSTAHRQTSLCMDGPEMFDINTDSPNAERGQS